MSFHDCDLDLREAERGEQLRRKHELAALGKAVSRELAAIHAKLDQLTIVLSAMQQRDAVAQPKPEKPMTISQVARRAKGGLR